MTLASAPPAAASSPSTSRVVGVATMPILFAVSFSHTLNDMMQALAPALFPVFKTELGLTFFQLGLITFTFQAVASVLQPIVGLATDRRPMPYALPLAMVFTAVGLVLLAFGFNYPMLLLSVAVIGIGSAIFHPEASRVARAASGGRYGFAQSVFQVGGNFGQSLGPLMAAFIIVPFGQRSVVGFTALAFMAVLLLSYAARWHVAHRAQRRTGAQVAQSPVSRRKVAWTLALLVTLLFSKTVYIASLGNYYTFYLIETFGVSVRDAQVLLFVFLGAVAVGTFIGGPIGDRIGRRSVIWGSILGVLPFTLLLPHLGLTAAVIDTIAIGLVLSSAFSAIVVYGQELAPGNVGAVAGLFFGLSFGLSGIGAAALGALIDQTSLSFVYNLCAFLPAIGVLAYFLPDLKPRTAG